MTSISKEQFELDLENILCTAASGYDSFSIALDNGLSAVLVDESEWNIMRDAFNMLVLSQRASADG